MPVHWADKPEGPIQRCSICGTTLVDYSRAAKIGRFFEGAVEVHDRGLTPTLDPADCCPSAED